LSNLKSLAARATAAALALAFATSAHAEQPDHPIVTHLWHTTYDVKPDGSSTETVEARYQVLQQRALENAKTYSISYSTSIQTGEILEAYTLKKDGRKLPVPPTNYQHQTNDGRKGASPMFSDRTRITAVMPDLEVGDSVYVRSRIAEKEPMFPGQFSMAIGYSPFAPYADVRLTVRAPREMKLLMEAHHVKAQPVIEQDGKRVHEWRWANPSPRRWNPDEDGGLWRRDESPGVLISTFADYESIARAYAARALPKAQPTPRIKELAAGITGTEARPREKARLLYEWVSRTLTYGGNCIGVGAVVPRDMDVVLDNKMGDCKDHATVLQALFTAAGIRSEQVLINAGSDYELAKTPVVSLVNHVMNYLPDFDLYVDATAKEIPFGYLPDGSYAKPVIHVGATKALATTPAQDHRTTTQKLRMALKIAENGSATGSMQVAVKGLAAAQMRAYMRELTGEAEADFVKSTLASAGMKGRGKLQKGETKGLVDTYEFAVQFEVDNYLRGGANGAMYFAPMMGTPHSVMAFAGVEDEPVGKRRQQCHGFHSEEMYDIELPATMNLLAMPESVQLKGSIVDYTASYEKTAKGVRVQREVHDKTATSICTPEVMAEFRKQAGPVAENLRTQVVYKRGAR
jgi:transglutaminase-like putative cysteine protease